MFKLLPFWTAGAVALMLTAGLKFLHYFKFIKWNPTGWEKRYGIFAGGSWEAKWLLLFAAIFLVALVSYYLFALSWKWKVSITAAVAGLLIAGLIEWLIVRPNGYDEFRKAISIPFAAMILVATRFVMETAVFHKKQQADT
ncbi:hypothetical protein AV656_02340 [Bhargavaea cecembensis]|uniref:Uncharacterized protein n=1 Tax=Bhargavaea cecembensis TaxID=394098 RepID=A0A165HIU8_9BACL|nr:hypothetical protein [Bhargavaea cecembensis]KZE40134.1 hypothetical protein AV656_02340 [Bhargavaea cecembensis]